MSLRTPIGPSGNLLSNDSRQCRRLVLDNPIITQEQLEQIAHPESGLSAIGIAKTAIVPITFPRRKEAPNGPSTTTSSV